MKWLSSFILCCCFSAAVMGAEAPTAQQSLAQLQQQWAVNNYQLTGKQQEKAFKQLLKQADEMIKQYPAEADLYLWRGIIESTYAGVHGGLGALKLAKAAKQDLEHSLELDPTALKGSAYTSLGALYFNVPGWPIGFGDDKKAEQMLKKALSLNPEGIDSNYFYGDYLRSERRYQEAQYYFQKALAAAPRPGRELADSGRKQEIEDAMQELAKKLD